MASRAMTNRNTAADWRIGLRRSIRRAAQMTGAGVLLLATLFLALALASYTQTDPSPSTAAAAGEVSNWMGRWGAFAADRVLFAFGLPGVLLLPLLYISARKLWRAVELDGADEGSVGASWWLPTGLLLIAIVLLGTVFSLAFDQTGGTLPAQLGGVSGLLGATGIEALATRFGGGASGWIILGAALVCLAGGTALLTRVFAIDWRMLLTLPNFAGGGAIGGAILSRLPFGKARKAPPAFAGDGAIEAPATKARHQPKSADEPPAAPAARRAPEISDPSAPPSRALRSNASLSSFGAVSTGGSASRSRLGNS